MLDLRTELSTLAGRRTAASIPDHEHVRGWGVFGLPFDSGHVLALRVFPENDFAPYRTVWHRDPAGRWSIYVDGPLDAACPRYYGPACEHTGRARIDIDWTGAASFRVVVDEPFLVWNVTATESMLLRVSNSVSPRLPEWTWVPGPLLRAREVVAHRILGMGDLVLSGVMPSGHHGVLMPKRMYWVDESRAHLEEMDLGKPTRLDEPPLIGDVPLPARGVLAIGGARWKINDPIEYERMRTLTDSRGGSTDQARRRPTKGEAGVSCEQGPFTPDARSYVESG